MDMMYASRAEAGQEPGTEASTKKELNLEPGSLGETYEKYLSGIKKMLNTVESSPEGELAELVRSSQDLLQDGAEWFKGKARDPEVQKKAAIEYIEEDKQWLNDHEAELTALQSLGDDTEQELARLQKQKGCLKFLTNFSYEVTGAFRGGELREPKAAIIRSLSPTSS